MKKYFLFSDVHGELTALIQSLEKKGFDKDNADHILVSLGDNFDRGDENQAVYTFLQKYQDEERFMGILGNHDEMLLNFITGLDDGIFNATHNGLDRTIFELSGKLQPKKFIYDYPNILIDKIRERNPKLLKFLKSLIDKIEINEYILTHAGYSPTNKYSVDKYKDLRWAVDNWARTPEFIDRFAESQDCDLNKIYVFGHWHAFRLHDEFFGQKINPDTKLPSIRHYTFEFENFRGIDTCSNLSKFVNILVIDEKVSD
jgi:serine/threonine protein phosphatase 1